MPPEAAQAATAFNPISQEYNADPAGVLRDARAEHPVFYSDTLQCWVVTRYEDIERALMDFATFSNKTLAEAPVPEGFQERVPTNFFAKSFNAMDPPEHNPIRKLGHSAFSRERMSALAPHIERAAHSLIDGFIEDGRCELMHQFCHAISHRTIVTMLELPDSDIPRLQQLAADLPRAFTGHLTPMPPAERDERWGRIADLRDYFREVVQQRRLAPGDDFVSMLIRATDENGGPLLTDDRIITHMTEMVFAGTDTTANLIPAAVMLFDQNQVALDRVTASADTMAAAIEEVLRVRSIVNGLFRKTTGAVDIAGVRVPSDALVYLALGSAGRDERRFADPDRFDAGRPEAAQHLGFGKGRHLCMGAPLARLEARLALTALYQRLPTLRVSPGQPFEYEPILLSLMLRSLHVEW